MTSKQRYSILLTWWPAACRAQHWNPADRSRRLQTISQAVARPIATMSDLDNSGDIDQVKAYLKYLADDLDGTIETGNPEPGERRRLLWLIHHHSMSLSHSSHSSHPSHDSYALSLAHDKFRVTPGLTTIEDLTTDQLRQLMMTLAARRCAKSRAAKNASLTSEEQFPDQVEFVPEPETASQPF